MKTALTILIFFCSTVLLYGDTDYQLQLYEKILPSIFSMRPLRVYVDKKTKDILKNDKWFEIMPKCDESVNVIIGKKFSDLPEVCLDKPLFATSYRSYKNYHNSFGAFYWRKGRPQLRFKKDVLERYRLVLPESLMKFAK
jgi:hypothetical protein